MTLSIVVSGTLENSFKKRIKMYNNNFTKKLDFLPLFFTRV